MANLTALAVARHVALKDRMDGATVYFSDQAHSSLEKLCAYLGCLLRTRARSHATQITGCQFSTWNEPSRKIAPPESARSA